MQVIFAPRDRFLAYLAAGWSLPFVVQPMPGAHGTVSIMLEREAT